MSSHAGDNLLPAPIAPAPIAPSERRRRILNGRQKAALWLLSVEEDVAVQILGRLNEPEIRSIADTVRKLGRTSSEDLVVVHQDFERSVKSNLFRLRGSTEYLGRVASRALGAERVKEAFAPLPPSPTEQLSRADEDVVAAVLAQEHPQTITAVLASLAASRSAAVIKRFPEDLRQEVVVRMAQLKRIPRDALAGVERVLSTGLSVPSQTDAEIDGVKVTAAVLNQLDTDVVEALLEEVANDERAWEVAGDLRKAMFTFEDLHQLDRRGFQALLKEVSNEQLTVAMKTASPDLREKIFGSLSKRAGEMLRDDLEVLGPTRITDVEEAQAAIVGLAMQLRSEGKIVLAGQAGDELV